VTAGDANEDPLPAIPAAVIEGCLFTAVGESDVVVDVVDVVVDVVVDDGAVDVVVEDEVVVGVAAVSAPAVVPVRTSARSDATPASMVALRRRLRWKRAEWRIVKRVFICVDSLGLGATDSWANGCGHGEASLLAHRPVSANQGKPSRSGAAGSEKPGQDE
jgi:hypothetical protein